MSDAAESLREFAEAVRISVSEGVDYARKSDMLWVTTTGDYGMSTHGFKIGDIEKAADTIEELQHKLKSIEDRLLVVEKTTPDYMLRANGYYILMTLIEDIRRRINS